MIDALIERLVTRVPELEHRIQGAVEFDKLMRTKAPPQHGLAAYVLPRGIAGGPPQAVAGMFVQDVQERVAVVLFLRGTDPTGKRALTRLQPFLLEVIEAIAGWAPGDEAGVFVLNRCEPIANEHGLLVFQIDFSINDQLRIQT